MTRRSRLEMLRDALTQIEAEEAPPSHLVAAARDLFDRPREAELPEAEVFQLFAAATGDEQQGLICTSASGLWTLEIFTAQSPEDRRAGRGQVLLSVHADHRATYEGRTARVFVRGPEGERVLAEAPISGGELFADISLDGLDLVRRDAINVTFGPRPGS